MAARVGRRDRATNIWPGFVDALATLLMVIIFLLLIFVLAQFFLSEALSGRDTALDKLRGQVTELADLLALERQEQKSLSDNFAELSVKLQTSIAMGNDLHASLAALRLSSKETATRLSAQLAAANDALTQVNLLREEERKNFELSMTELHKTRAEERHELETRIGEAEALGNKANERLKIQIMKVTELNQDIAALKTLREELETKIANMAAKAVDADKALASTQKALANMAAKAADADKALASTQKTLLEEQILSETARAWAEKKLKMQIKEITGLVQDIAALKALREELEARITKLIAKAGEADNALSSNKKALLEERELSKSARAKIALLNKQTAALRAQLSRIEAALNASEKHNANQKIQIVNLGKRLNSALASKVQELSRYRSEFFGRLRDVLGRQPGLRIVGDRFVFQSEVLFDKGSADIGAPGQSQLTTLAATLKVLSNKIPKDIDWVLRIDGHTDSDPIKTTRFPSNWELSTARAIAVVQKLIDQGLAANRLVAAGFGKFRPIDGGQDEIAKRRNRRIELKLTQR